MLRALRTGLLVLALAFSGIPGRAYAFPADGQPLVCSELLAQLAHPELWQFKTDNLAYRSGSNNAHFIEQAVEGRIPAGMLFIHIENAVLRSLNNEYFLDKGLTGAVESLYTRLFLERLAKAGLRPVIADLVYSDYKTIRLGFSKDSPGLRRALARIHAETAVEFRDTLNRYPALLELVKRAEGPAAAPEAWHMAGIGRTPDEAAAAARHRRQVFDPAKPITPVGDFSSKEVQEFFTAGLGRVDGLREGLQQGLTGIFGEGTALLVGFSHYGKVRGPAIELISLIRRHGELSDAEYLAEMKVDLAARFPGEAVGLQRAGLNQVLLAAREYWRLVDTFSPSIYERNEIMDLRIHEGENGVVMFDLAGQGDRNMLRAMKSLANSARAPVPDGMTRLDLALQLTREGQTLESSAFERRRARFAEAIGRLGIPGELIISGDDGVFLPSRPLTDGERSRLVAVLAEVGRAGDHRVAFLPRRFEGSETLIPARYGAHLLSNGDKIEKALRRALESREFPLSRLGQTAFGVILRPSEAGQVTVDLVVRGQRDADLIAAIARKFPEVLPKGYVMGRIDSVEVAPEVTTPAGIRELDIIRRLLEGR